MIATADGPARSVAAPLAVATTVLATHVLVVCAMAIAILVVRPENRPLVVPMLALGELTLLYVTVLWCRDGELPVFESGTMHVLATGAYGIIALLGFVRMQGAWDPQADARLQAYLFNAAELGSFGWRYVVYLASFAVVYLVVRGRASATGVDFAPVPRTTVTVIVVLLVVLYLARLVLLAVYGPSADLQSDPEATASVTARPMPYPLRQLAHNLVSALLVVKQAMLTLIVARWRCPAARLVVLAWLALAAVATAAHLGSRTNSVLLLLSFGMLYHRLVRPLSALALSAAGAALLTGFLLHGAVRHSRGLEPFEREYHPVAGANEFQAIFTNGFDLQKRRDGGVLPAVPWQIHAVDLYLTVPSQLLPFEKFEPSAWYAGAIGVADSGIGLMFGVIAQSVVGYGWIELVLRGAALATVMALLHRWYVRRASQLWPTLLYLFVATWSYFSFRATTLWPVYFVVYQFVPVLLFAKLLELALGRSRGEARLLPQAPPA